MPDRMATTPAHRLRLRRVHARYLVDRGHPDPERVRHALDAALSRGLTERLAAALEPALPASDPGVWRVRELRVEIAVELDTERAGDTDAVAQAFARGVGRALLRALAGGPDGEDVVWFPDRAAFLAGYLERRAEGREPAWYHSAFEGLGLLPASAAVRTAVLDDPEIGLAALRSLGPDRLGRVAASLAAADALRVLDALAALDPDGEPDACSEAVWSAPAGLGLSSAEAEALGRFVVAYSPGRVAGSTLREAAVQAARRDGGARAGVVVAPTRAEPAVPPGLALETPSEPGEPTSVPGTRGTPYGGAFLLLPLLDDLPYPEATAGWPDLGRTPAAQLARFLTLVKCLGAAAYFDPLLREILGVGDDPDAPAVLEWQSRLTREDRNRFLATLEAWWIDRGALTLEDQRLERHPGCAVLIDEARGHWRGVVPGIPGRPERTARNVARLLKDAPLGGRLHVTPRDPVLVSGLLAEIPALDVTTSDVEGGSVPSDGGDPRRLTLEALGVLSGASDRTLSVAAANVLRGFAWGLPGFSRSGFAHLRANFLGSPARLDEEPGRRVVTLSRPPLGVILNVTGKSRETYRLSWLDERPLALFPEA